MSARVIITAGLVALAASFVAWADEPVETRVVTLRAWDDVGASIDFETGTSGAWVEEGELIRDLADLILQEDGRLVYGSRFRERALLVDCGDFRIAPTGAPRSIGAPVPVSVLHTLELAGGKLNYRGAAGQAETFGGAKMLFGAFPPAGAQSFQPLLGHVYLLRYVSEGGPGEGRLAAFRVIDIQPDGLGVTLRYRLLN